MGGGTGGVSFPPPLARTAFEGACRSVCKKFPNVDVLALGVAGEVGVEMFDSGGGCGRWSPVSEPLGDERRTGEFDVGGVSKGVAGGCNSGVITDYGSSVRPGGIAGEEVDSSMTGCDEVTTLEVGVSSGTLEGTDGDSTVGGRMPSAATSRSVA